MVRRSLILLLRLRVWAAEHLRPGEVQVTLLWAGVVGLLGGLSSVYFGRALEGVQWLFTAQGGDIVEAARRLAWWQRLLIPALGGVLAGAAITLGMRLAKGQASTDYLEAIVIGDGVIRSRPTLVRSGASLLAIASGASIGREGPMVQLAAWLGSFAARRAKFATPRRRLIVACGAAAGIASAYNAPIAGALFVAEIVIGTIAMESFGPLIFSSVIATLTVRQLQGPDPVYEIPAFHLVSPVEILPYLLLGLLCGIVGVGFLRLLRRSARLFGRRSLPPAVTLGLGGAIVGLLSIRRPDIWGNGYGVVSSILEEEWWWQSLLAVLAFKVLATAASFGSGAPGGVFTPTLFVGAAVGGLFGQAVHDLLPSLTADHHAYALVGMGCMLAATTQAPLMAILMLFELTLDYAIILPLMLGCVTAYQMAHGLEKRPIYDHGQKRRTVLWPGVPLEDVRVGSLVRPDPPIIHAAARFDEIARRFLMQRHNHLYVVDGGSAFLGAIALHDIKSYLGEEQLTDLVTAHDLAEEDFPVITEAARVAEALQAFSLRDVERLPVIASPADRTLRGSITKTDLLLVLAEGTEHATAKA